MLKKLKSKIKIWKSELYTALSVGFLAVLIFSCVPFSALAQAIPLPNIVPNSISVNLSSNQASLGTNISLTAALTGSNGNGISPSTTFVATVSNANTQQNLVTTKGSGTSLTQPLTISVQTPAFVTGQNTLQVTFAYTSSAGVAISSTQYQGTATINVSPASQTGAATVQISTSLISGGASTNSVQAQVIINFNQGAGPPAAQFNYDCGNGSTGNVTSLSSPSFTCSYSQTVQNYTIKVVALDANGNVLATTNDAQSQFAVTSSTVSGTVNQVTGGAQTLLGLINNIINFLLGVIEEFLYAVFFWLVAPIIQALLSIHPYTDAFVNVIYPGWIVVRNVCNIFFIIALIVIAMATLFRLESYQFRHLLVQLIIAALLVNFSLVIGQAILGVADTVQAQFLPANVTVIQSLAGNLMVSPYRQVLLNSQAWLDPATQGSFAQTVQPLFLLALSMGTFAVFAAIAVFLLIRIVALWLLLLVSPVAYAVGVLPSTAHYRAEWWKQFLKYAFFTPIMAFFLNMTAVMYNLWSSNNNSLLKSITDPTLGTQLGGVASFVFIVASDLLMLAFLIAALKVAEQAGIYGAAGITNLAQQGIFAPFKVAGGGVKLAGNRVGRFWNEFTSSDKVLGHQDKISAPRKLLFAVLNPVAAVKGQVKRGQELREAAQHKAEAGGLMVVEQFWTGGHKVIPRIQQHAKAEADKFVKDFNSMSREKQVDALKEISGLRQSEEDKAQKRGMITSMMSRGFIDDAVQDGTMEVDQDGDMTGTSPLFEQMKKNTHFKVMNPGGARDPATGKWVGIENEHWYFDPRDGKYKMKYNDYTMSAMFESLFGTHDQEAMRMLAEEGEKYGKDTFHSEYMRGAHYDLKDKVYKWSLDMAGGKQGKNFAASEISKMDARQQAKTVYHALMGLTNDGEMDEALLSKIEKNILEMPAWQQERNPDQIIFGRTIEEGTGPGQNFNSVDGSVRIDPGTFLRLRNMTQRQRKSEITASIYLKATGGALTNGDFTKTTVKKFVEEMRYIQSQAPGTVDETKLRTHMESIKGPDYKLALDISKISALSKNGGVKAEVHEAKDHDFTGPALTTVVDIKGNAGGPAGSSVPVDIIKF